MAAQLRGGRGTLAGSVSGSGKAGALISPLATLLPPTISKADDRGLRVQSILDCFRNSSGLHLKRPVSFIQSGGSQVTVEISSSNSVVQGTKFELGQRRFIVYCIDNSICQFLQWYVLTVSNFSV